MAPDECWLSFTPDFPVFVVSEASKTLIFGVFFQAKLSVWGAYNSKLTWQCEPTGPTTNHSANIKTSWTHPPYHHIWKGPFERKPTRDAWSI
jgi:hypothetical protein